MLLVIGGTLGVDASSVPISDATRDAPVTFGSASGGASSDDENRRVLDGGPTSAADRMALLEQALGWHQREELENAAEGYSRLLEVRPKVVKNVQLFAFLLFVFSFIMGLSPRPHRVLEVETLRQLILLLFGP